MSDDVSMTNLSCFRLRRTLLGPVRHGRRRAAVAAGLAIGIALHLVQPARAGSEASSFSTRFAAVEEPSAEAVATPAPEAPAGAAKDSAGKSAPPPPTGPVAVPDRRTHYRALIEKEAAGTGLAPEIAEAVMGVESGYNPDAIGGVGEIGLMQLLPSTARMLGFSGTLAELAIPENNIHYGVMYLAQAWRRASGDLCTAVMKYRAGHGETRFSYLSVNYCVAVRARLFARGFRVTGTVPVATFGEPSRAFGGGGGGCGRKCLGGMRIGRVDLATLNTRLNALVVQARGGR